jgi:hypothetical protein
LKTSYRAALWLIWCLVVFGAMNIYAAPEPFISAAPAQQADQETASGFVRLLRAVRDDGDIRRYFAYSNAILGRPYDGYYVRTDADGPAPIPSDHELVSPKRPARPWRDFSVEYPPGMLGIALIPALFTTDFGAYHFAFGLLMEVMLTASVWLSVRSADQIAPGSGGMTLLLSILFVAALGQICARRYDGAVALTIAAAIHGLVARRPRMSGVWLAAGIIAKGAPLLLAPLGAIFLARRGRVSELRVAILSGGLTLAVAATVYFLIASPRAFDAITYHANRPVQIESLAGSLLLLARQFNPDVAHIVFTYGSHNVASPWEPPLRETSIILSILAIAAIIAWFWRAIARADDEMEAYRVFLAASAASVIAYVALGKVFSPQYLVWLLPIGAISCALSSPLSRALLIGACALAQFEYPFVYKLTNIAVEPLLGEIALARNILLLWMAVTLMRDASRGRAGETRRLRPDRLKTPPARETRDGHSEQN